MLQRSKRGVEMMNSPPYRCHSFPFCDKKYQIPYDLIDMMSLITSKNIIVSHSRWFKKGRGGFLCIALDLICLFFFLAFVCPLGVNGSTPLYIVSMNIALRHFGIG